MLPVFSKSPFTTQADADDVPFAVSPHSLHGADYVNVLPVVCLSVVEPARAGSENEVWKTGQAGPTPRAGPGC